jgi:hypothetical protein
VTVSTAYIPDTNDTAVPALATTVLHPRLATTRCAQGGETCAMVVLQSLERGSVLFVELAPLEKKNQDVL